MSATNTKVLTGAVTLAVGLLAGLEGYEAGPYVDVAGVLTDCYGNTKNVRRGFIRSFKECKALLQGEAERIGLMVYSDNPDIPQSVLVAGISFAYNIGDGGYRGSTFRREMMKGNYGLACESMKLWNKITVNGKLVVSRGLVNRRNHEYNICMEYQEDTNDD